MSYLVGRFDLCTGCDICRLVCSELAAGGYNPRLARLRVTMSEEGLTHFPVVCAQCENAFCEKVCPASAISRDKDSGALRVDEEKCIGCGSCADACPLNVIVLHEGKAKKCDLCGGEPECVRSCPTKAIRLVDGEGGP